MIGCRGCVCTNSSENTYRTIVHACIHILNSNTDIQTRVCAVPVVCHNVPSCGYGFTDHIVGDRRCGLIDCDRGSTSVSLLTVSGKVCYYSTKADRSSIIIPASRTVREGSGKLCFGYINDHTTGYRICISNHIVSCGKICPIPGRVGFEKISSNNLNGTTSIYVFYNWYGNTDTIIV